MANPFTFGRLDVELVSAINAGRSAPRPETPFRIVVMGDFSGRTGRDSRDSGAAHAKRRLHLVDRDNLDELMGALGAGLVLPFTDDTGAPAIISLSAMDDFHPDRLFDTLDVFKKIKTARRKLSDPASFAKASAEMGRQERTAGPPAAKTETEEAVRVSPPGVAAEGLLDRILDQGGAGPSRETPYRDLNGWNRFLRAITEPYIVPDIEQKQSEILAALDSTTSELMRAILNHPAFKELESSWRGLHFLISRIETSEQIEVYLLDLSKAQLGADLMSANDLRDTATYRLLVEQRMEVPGPEPIALIAGNYVFGDGREDAELLGRLGKIAAAAGAPFVAAAGDKLLGCDSLVRTPDPGAWKQPGDIEGAWNALRKLPEAGWIGLALPRFILRLPYGADTDPTERFDFEEIENHPAHDQYLWGNPCFICSLLIARAFSEYGWDMRPGVVQDVENLPLHVFKECGQSTAKPCAEVVLTERAAEAILEKGFMPLLSFRNRDAVRLGRFQAISDPARPLAGIWSFASKQF